MWVVLRFENQYNQFGGYFVGIFESEEDAESPNGHFGRENFENTWHELVNVKTGVIYKEEDLPSA